MDNIVEKAAAAFGFDTPSADEIVKRSDYKTDAEYITALADMSQRMESPEFRRFVRKATADYREREEKKERQRQHDEYMDILKGISLDDTDMDEINQEATRMAQADLAAGKITYSQLGVSISRHGDELAKRKKEQKATNRQINAMFRRSAGR